MNGKILNLPKMITPALAEEINRQQVVKDFHERMTRDIAGYIEARYQAITTHAAKLVECYIAETGIEPSDAVIHVETTKDGGMMISVKRQSRLVAV